MPATTNAETAMDGEFILLYLSLQHCLLSLSSFFLDISLPALFMPTPSSRPVIYNPRAHSYFHPPGSLNSRVSQPPAIFKLPPVQQPGVSFKI